MKDFAELFLYIFYIFSSFALEKFQFRVYFIAMYAVNIRNYCVLMIIFYPAAPGVEAEYDRTK